MVARLRNVSLRALTPCFAFAWLATVVALCGNQAGEMPDPVSDQKAFFSWQTNMRSRLADLLGIPDERVALDSESRGRFELDGIVIEKWVFTSEPGSRVPAVLYRPIEHSKPLPGVVLTFGHGGSKSQPAYNYIGQLLAKIGIACLALDPIGEEERHIRGAMGTRAHDPFDVHCKAWCSGRPIMGKMVFDTMRGVDFLLSREDIDPRRIGVAGNSLGGAIAAWMAVLDVRLRFAVVSGWAFAPATEKWGKIMYQNAEQGNAKTAFLGTISCFGCTAMFPLNCQRRRRRNHRPR